MQSHPVLFKSIKKSEPTLLMLGSSQQLRGYRADRALIFDGKELEMISIGLTGSHSLEFFGYGEAGKLHFISDEVRAKLKIDAEDFRIIKNVADGTENSVQRILDAVSQLEKENVVRAQP